MNVFIIKCFLVSISFLIFSKGIQCFRITDKIYNYKGVKIPEDCKDIIRENTLLQPEKLPKFRDMSSKDIEKAYKCAQDFYKENAKQLDSLAEREKSAFHSVIEAPIYFIRHIKDTMLQNNFTEDLREMHDRLDITDDKYRKFQKSYNQLLKEYNDNLRKSKKNIGLFVSKYICKFPDARNYPIEYLEHWFNAARKQGYGLNNYLEEGPWYLDYKALDYVGRTTSCTELRKEIYDKLSRWGHTREYNNEEVIKRLRVLYNKEAEESKYSNVVYWKMQTCMAKSFESVNKFLYEVERNLAENQDEYAYTMEEHYIAKSVMDAYFPHHHVINKLFDIINEYFQIFIEESKDDYQIYAPGVQLYEVYVSNEKIGLFYIDYFARKLQKVASSPYTTLLRYRINHLNIIPIAFISLQNQSEEKFSLKEIRVLFHEMGHCLQRILSDYNKGWGNFDTIEFPAKFMEFFAYQEKHILELSAESRSERLNQKTYRKYNNILQKAEGISLIESLHKSITDLNIFARPEEDISGIIKEVRDKFKYKRTCDKTFRSGLPDYLYVGTYYSYILSEFLAIDAYDYLHSDSSKFEERLLKFRRLVFEMKQDNTLEEAFHTFMGRKKINVEPFYKFYGITSQNGLRSI